MSCENNIRFLLRVITEAVPGEWDNEDSFFIPDHNCEFDSRPDKGGCDFHDKWCDIWFSVYPDKNAVGPKESSPPPLDQGRADSLQKLVNKQAEDEGLWFEAKYITEAYLQKELRRLHAAIEAMTPTPNNEGK